MHNSVSNSHKSRLFNDFYDVQISISSILFYIWTEKKYVFADLRKLSQQITKIRSTNPRSGTFAEGPQIL